MLQGMLPGAWGSCRKDTTVESAGNIVVRVAALWLSVWLGGCEAKLDLRQVEAEAAKPIHRFDNIQDIVRANDGIVAVGLGGVVLHSTDDGQTWRRTELSAANGGTPPSLIDVDVCGDGRVVALDFSRRVWLSTGTAWQPVALPVNEDAMSLDCDPNGRVWVVGSFTTVLRLEQDGKTWTDFSVGEDAILSAVQFVSEDVGFIVGEFGTVMKTSDGGNTWDAAPPIEHEFFPQTAYFESASKGWVIGLNGTIMRTDDGANTWVREETPTRAPLYRIMDGNGSLYVGGNFGTFLTYDRTAQSWRPATAEPPALTYLRAIYAVDSQTVIIGGGGFLAPVSIAPTQRSAALIEE